MAYYGRFVHIFTINLAFSFGPRAGCFVVPGLLVSIAPQRPDRYKNKHEVGPGYACMVIMTSIAGSLENEPAPDMPAAPRRLAPPSRRRAFTFVEIIVAMGVLVLFTGSALAALTQFNRYAASARLRGHALSLAQQRVDEILTTQWRANAAAPAVLTLGTRTETDLILNADIKNQASDLKSLFTDLVTPVKATRVTTITSVSTRLVRADVTVTFTYVNRNYSISLRTMRTTDTI